MLKPGKNECKHCKGSGCYFCKHSGYRVLCPQCLSDEYVEGSNNNWTCHLCDYTFDNTGERREDEN